jgi:hypothetical protein
MVTNTQDGGKAYPFRLYKNDIINRNFIVEHYQQRDPTIDFAKLLRLLMQQHADAIRAKPTSFPLLSHE